MAKSIYIIIILFISQRVLATPTIEIKWVGGNTYVLDAKGLEKIGGIDLYINYNSEHLKNPSIIDGFMINNAISAKNTDINGVIRIAVIKADGIEGSGEIATINFESNGQGQGKITELKAVLATIDANRIEANTYIYNPPVTESFTTEKKEEKPQPEQRPTITQEENLKVIPIREEVNRKVETAKPQVVQEKNIEPKNENTSQTITNQNTIVSTDKNEKKKIHKGSTSITIPKEIISALPVEKKEDIDANQKVTIKGEISGTKEIRTSTQQNTEEGKKSALINLESMPSNIITAGKYECILNKLRDKKEKLNAKLILTLLKEKEENYGIKQEPAIALSDGKSEIKILLPVKTEPNYFIEGEVKYKYFEKDENGFLRLILLPQKNIEELTVTFYLDKKIEFQVNIARPIKFSKDLFSEKIEEDIDYFIKNREAKKSKKYDLNKDGKFDYIDDYIYAVNRFLYKK